jgi:hypothetical protein
VGQPKSASCQNLEELGMSVIRPGDFKRVGFHMRPFYQSYNVLPSKERVKAEYSKVATSVECARL